MPRDNERPFGSDYRQALRTSAGTNSSVYGFSIMITSALALLSALHGVPPPGRLFAFAGGTVAAFALVEGAATRGFRQPLSEEPSVVKALGSSASFVSVGVSLGLVWLLGWGMDSVWLWPVAPFCATSVYLILFALELAVARRVERRTTAPRE